MNTGIAQTVNMITGNPKAEIPQENGHHHLTITREMTDHIRGEVDMTGTKDSNTIAIQGSNTMAAEDSSTMTIEDSNTMATEDSSTMTTEDSSTMTAEDSSTMITEDSSTMVSEPEVNSGTTIVHTCVSVQQHRLYNLM